jgi:predicted RNA-binding Zn-ribbon protein involved in translation (DUF1610 family)
VTAEPSTLGSCPHCGTAVGSVHVLIEYETAEGEAAVWAECPGCGEVVDPT